jgi:acyl-CoA thioesterase
VPTRFERDTAITRVDASTFAAQVDAGWLVYRGPNGGYVGAIVLRALAAAVDDPSRSPRSLTIHYVAPAEVGEMTVVTSVDRVGRSLTSCSARVHQAGRLVAIAVAAFSKPRDGVEFCDATMPAVPPPDGLATRSPLPDTPPIAYRWDTRWAIGREPWADTPASADAVAGGWIRLEEPQLLDAFAVAAMTDAWVPPVFSRVGARMFVPTIDLTVHFRTSLPLVIATADDFMLVVFRTTAAKEGFLEEDGEVWSRDGTLVAQSRQLAAMIALSP